MTYTKISDEAYLLEANFELNSKTDEIMNTIDGGVKGRFLPLSTNDLRDSVMARLITNDFLNENNIENSLNMVVITYNNGNKKLDVTIGAIDTANDKSMLKYACGVLYSE